MLSYSLIILSNRFNINPLPLYVTASLFRHYLINYLFLLFILNPIHFPFLVALSFPCLFSRSLYTLILVVLLQLPLQSFRSLHLIGPFVLSSSRPSSTTPSGSFLSFFVLSSSRPSSTTPSGSFSYHSSCCLRQDHLLRPRRALHVLSCVRTIFYDPVGRLYMTPPCIIR